jgi:two-component system, chemotaxis family, CheB/CheR fusion protein
MDERDLLDILAVVDERRGIDFRDYRVETVRNRLASRMSAAGCANAGVYAARLRVDGEEVERLVQALLVAVTGFFRDEEVFAELSRHVLPALVASAPTPRAWVVGTATGEEAYTVAMLFAECTAQGRGSGFQVLASDLDERSLAVAREGIYPDAALQPVTPELRKRYFRRSGDGMRVVESLRGRIAFARHDVMGHRLAPSEAVVAAFDLILCRNVLLYFDESLRAKAVERLAGMLQPGGAFVIGSSETLPMRASRFFESYPGVSTWTPIFRRTAR